VSFWWSDVEVGDVLEWSSREELYVVLGFKATLDGRHVRLLCLWDGRVVDEYPARLRTCESHARKRA
jgi:hypothetical protein